VTAAALVLGITGTVLAALSLGWQVWSFRLQGARPKLMPVIGVHHGDGMYLSDATDDVHQLLDAIAAQYPDGTRMVGVQVVNAGRTPFHVAGWSMRVEPAGALYLPGDPPIGCPDLPCDIPAGATETFFTALDNIHVLQLVGEVNRRPQRLVATVTGGGRTFTSKPINMPMLTDGSR
jgi:hypothetical protein